MLCTIARATCYTDNHIVLAQPDCTTLYLSDVLARSIVFRGLDRMSFAAVVFSPDQPPEAVSKLL